MGKPKGKINNNTTSAPVTHRTIRTFLPYALTPACQSISRHVRDIHNTAVHLGRVAFGCFEWSKKSESWVLVEEKYRPEGWSEVLTAFDAAVDGINADRSKQAQKGETKPLLIKKLSQLNGSAPSSVILNMTLFHRVVRTWPDALDAQKRSAYSRVPSCLAKPACENVREMFCTWLKTLSAWRREAKTAFDPAQSAPSMPSYAKRGSLPSFTIFCSAASLPKIAKFGLQTGEAKDGDLSEKDAKAFTKFDIVRHVEKSLTAWSKSHPAGDTAAPKMLQFTPQAKLIQLDIVAAVEDRPPAGSFLDELAQRFPEGWEARRNDKDLLENWVKNLVAAQTWSHKTMPASDSLAWISQGFGAMGVDPGQNNLLSLGFSSGAKMRVFSGQAFERKVASFDRRIDKLASRLTTPEQRLLAAKIEGIRNAGGDVELADRLRLRELASQVWRDPRILSVRQKKQAYRKDQAHRLARMVANQAAHQKIAVAVLSRNKGLKKGNDHLSTQANRRAHNIPHNLFAQLLREKLRVLGVALIEHEESFTSQASFVDNDPLPTHSEGREQMAAQERKVKAKQAAMARKGSTGAAVPEKSEPHHSKAEAAQSREDRSLDKINGFKRPTVKQQKFKTQHSVAISGSPNTFLFSGARDASDRHWFVRQGPLDARGLPRTMPHKTRLHADGQAALNAIRKVCPAFVCSSHVHLAHEIMILRCQGWKVWSKPHKPQLSC